MRFDFTDNYVYTCRDCKKNMACVVTKGGTVLNSLPCMDSLLEPKEPKTTHATSDYHNLLHQVTIMLCGMQSAKNQFMREDLWPAGFKTGITDRKHTFTDYCNFEEILRKFYNFLKDNEEYKDNNSFVNDMIKTIIILEDGKVNVYTNSTKLKSFMNTKKELKK